MTGDEPGTTGRLTMADETTTSEATVEGDVKPGDTVEVVPEGAPADATATGDVKPGDELEVTDAGDGEKALTGAGDPEGAALPVEGEHPEPTPLAFIHQDNVTEPGVQITRAPSNVTGNIEESRHQADGDVVPGEDADVDAAPGEPVEPAPL